MSELIYVHTKQGIGHDITNGTIQLEPNRDYVRRFPSYQKMRRELYERLRGEFVWCGYGHLKDKYDYAKVWNLAVPKRDLKEIDGKAWNILAGIDNNEHRITEDQLFHQVLNPKNVDSEYRTILLRFPIDSTWVVARI
jgi:hypothetical protein